MATLFRTDSTEEVLQVHFLLQCGTPGDWSFARSVRAFHELTWWSHASSLPSNIPVRRFDRWPCEVTH